MDWSCFGSCLVAYGKAISTDYSLIPSAQYLTLRLTSLPTERPAPSRSSRCSQLKPRLRSDSWVVGKEIHCVYKVSSVATRFSLEIPLFEKLVMYGEQKKNDLKWNRFRNNSINQTKIWNYLIKNSMQKKRRNLIRRKKCVSTFVFPII